MKLIYLDNNATTQPAPEVVQAMQPFYETMWGNPSSFYRFGNDLQRHVEKARTQVAALIGAKRPSEIIFTASGTESIVTAIHATTAQCPEKRHIVTTAVEHPATLLLCEQLKARGYDVTSLSVDQSGMLSLDALEASLRPDTAAVSIMWANNETGVIFPIDRIAEICARHRVHVHVDAVQAAGKIPIDLSQIPITSLSLSAHKLHGPKGIGALYVRRGTPFLPLFPGHQEMHRRGGTENVAGIVGFGQAAQLALEGLSTNVAQLTKLRNTLEAEIARQIPAAVINGRSSPRICNTSNISFPRVESEALLLMLQEAGICASSGSACTSGSLAPSHVLKAMGLPRELLSGVLRISLCRYTTENDVVEALRTLIPTALKMTPKA